MNNRAILLTEPKTTLAQVAELVPRSLRGEVYSLYLIQMRSYWDRQPSYVFDEWVAYTNGSEARRRLGIQERGETVRYMLEFVVYSACVAKATNDDRLRPFLQYQTERSIAILKVSTVPTNYLNTLRTAPDAEDLRNFMRGYFGKAWTRITLNF